MALPKKTRRPELRKKVKQKRKEDYDALANEYLRDFPDWKKTNNAMLILGASLRGEIRDWRPIDREIDFLRAWADRTRPVYMAAEKAMRSATRSGANVPKLTRVQLAQYWVGLETIEHLIHEIELKRPGSRN